MATDIQRIIWAEELKDAPVRAAILELAHAILETFPEAEFRVYANPEYRGAIVEVYTDSDDAFAVFDLVSDRVVDLLVDEDISIRLMPVRRTWPQPVDP